MHRFSFKVISDNAENVNSRILWQGEDQSEAYRFLHALHIPAVVRKWDAREGTAEIVNDNHDVFPLEPEVKSAWIPVGERLPERLKDETTSDDVLFAACGKHWTGCFSHVDKVWVSQCGFSFDVTVSHWCPLPALP